MKNVHLEKSLKNHMGSRKNRNFEKTDFFDFQSENVRIFSFSKIFFANVDFDNRKFLIFLFQTKVAENIFM